MSTLVIDCPRCATKRVTFDVMSNVLMQLENCTPAAFSEALCRCRACRRSSIAIVERRLYQYAETVLIDENAAMWTHDNGLANHDGPLRNCLKSIRLVDAPPPPRVIPEHVPHAIRKVQAEANTCLASGCWNAAGALYCAVLDLATRDALDRFGAHRLRARTERELPRRLKYMFDHNYLPRDLQLLSDCVQVDTDAIGVWFSEADAEDLFDFATEILRRVYTEPARVHLAVKRRAQRASA